MTNPTLATWHDTIFLPKEVIFSDLLTPSDRLVAVTLYDLGYDASHAARADQRDPLWEYQGSLKNLATRSGLSWATVNAAIDRLFAAEIIGDWTEREDLGLADWPFNELGHPRRQAPEGALRLRLRSPFTPDMVEVQRLEATDPEFVRNACRERQYSASGYVRIPLAAVWEHRRHGGPRSSGPKLTAALRALLVLLAYGDHDDAARNRSTLGTRALARAAYTRQDRWATFYAAAQDVFPGIVSREHRPNSSPGAHSQGRFHDTTLYFVDWSKAAWRRDTSTDLGATAAEPPFDTWLRQEEVA